MSACFERGCNGCDECVDYCDDEALDAIMRAAQRWSNEYAYIGDFNFPASRKPFKEAVTAALALNAQPQPVPVAEVRRNTNGGMAYIVPLIPPEKLTHGMKLYSAVTVVASPIDTGKLVEHAYAEGRKDEAAERDVGSFIHEGNTVSYMYARAKAYGDEIMRVWFVLKDAGKHPGRTDDPLHEVVRAALAKRASVEPAEAPETDGTKT